MRNSSLALIAAALAAGPPAAWARCPDQPPFVSDATIRFETGSANLDANDIREIRETVARASMRRTGQVCVYGSAGKNEGGESLARDRAEAVADELRAAGVPMFQIDVIPVSGGGGLLGSMMAGGSVEIVLEP